MLDLGFAGGNSYRLSVDVILNGSFQCGGTSEEFLVDCMEGHGRVSGPGISVVRVDDTRSGLKHSQTSGLVVGSEVTHR